MHVGQNILKTVVFIGYADTNSPTGFKCEGTAFLFHYKSEGYLITARHVAETVGSDPFNIRVNTAEGKAVLLHADSVGWTVHPDGAVDLAAVALRLTDGMGFDAQYLGEEDVLTPDRLKSEDIDVGDFTYTLGLFHFVHGQSRNLPLVYTGHLAMIPPPGERIPMGDGKGGTEFVEAYLIESGVINGASGSPVLARSSFTWKGMKLDQGQTLNGLMPEAKLLFLGVLQGAWFLPPDDPLRKSVQTKLGDVVPVGLGVVVPAYKLIELLEVESLREARAKAKPVGARKLSVSDVPKSSLLLAARAGFILNLPAETPAENPIQARK